MVIDDFGIIFRAHYCRSTVHTMATHPPRFLPLSPLPPSFPPPFSLIDCHLRTRGDGRGRTTTDSFAPLVDVASVTFSRASLRDVVSRLCEKFASASLSFPPLTLSEPPTRRRRRREPISRFSRRFLNCVIFVRRIAHKCLQRRQQTNSRKLLKIECFRVSSTLLLHERTAFSSGGRVNLQCCSSPRNESSLLLFCRPSFAYFIKRIPESEIPRGPLPSSRKFSFKFNLDFDSALC